MKQKIYFFLLFILFCSKAKSQNLCDLKIFFDDTIKPNLVTTISIYEGNTRLDTLIKNGKYFIGKIKSKYFDIATLKFYRFADTSKYSICFINIEPQNIHIKITKDKESGYNYKYLYPTPEYKNAQYLNTIINEYLTAFEKMHDKPRYKNKLENFTNKFIRIIETKRHYFSTILAVNTCADVFEFKITKRIYNLFPNYIKQSRAGKSIKEFINFKEGIKILVNKKIKPNIYVTNNNENSFSLDSILNSKKYTLVVFGFSNCKPCRDEHNDLKLILNNNIKKINVVNISVDEDKLLWKKAIEIDNIQSFINIINEAKIKNKKLELTKEFKILGYPTHFLLKNNKIILSNQTLENIEKYLRNN